MKPTFGVSKFGEFTFAIHFLATMKNDVKKVQFVLQLLTIAWADEAILSNRWGIAAERGLPHRMVSHFRFRW